MKWHHEFTTPDIGVLKGISWFENHLRAGLRFLSVQRRCQSGYAAMINWIGEGPPVGFAIRKKDVHWHIYGLKQNRPGRKVGHSTVVADNAEELHQKVVNLAKLLEASNGSLKTFVSSDLLEDLVILLLLLYIVKQSNQKARPELSAFGSFFLSSSGLTRRSSETLSYFERKRSISTKISSC
ncbi:MAG: hypothetical protein R3F25_12080 [Gammaproteobacteria bacterium]